MADTSSPAQRACRRATDLARDPGVNPQTIYLWRHQEQIDRGLVAGLTSMERADTRACYLVHSVSMALRLSGQPS